MAEKKSTYTGQTDARRKASAKYLKEVVEDIRIRVPKGQKEVIKAHADKQDESMNTFVIRAIDETMLRDNGVVPSPGRLGTKEKPAAISNPAAVEKAKIETLPVIVEKSFKRGIAPTDDKIKLALAHELLDIRIDRNDDPIKVIAKHKRP